MFTSILPAILFSPLNRIRRAISLAWFFVPLILEGLLWQEGTPEEPQREHMWLRFVSGRPVSTITTQFLDWCCQRLLKQGKTNWLLIWDNASWHKSKAVRMWIRQHNQQVKQMGKGVRILPFLLPTQSPWLNPIEPKWVHGKQNVVESNGLLTAKQLAERVCAYYAHEVRNEVVEELLLI